MTDAVIRVRHDILLSAVAVWCCTWYSRPNYSYYQTEELICSWSDSLCLGGNSKILWMPAFIFSENWHDWPNCLTLKSQCVKSDVRPVCKAVPQGLVLGPLLFTITLMIWIKVWQAHVFIFMLIIRLFTAVSKSLTTCKLLFMLSRTPLLNFLMLIRPSLCYSVMPRVGHRIFFQWWCLN